MLKAVAKISGQDWLSSSEAKQLFSILNPKADEGAFDSLFVGGCVRNAYIDKDVTDIDICTRFLPNDVEDMLIKAGVKAIPTGKEHGTITAVINEKPFEITTLRKDIETDGRHAVVEFTEHWLEDAKRRDFTMNTLLADIEGNIYDPLERGITDLDARHVIFVGDPETRIQEDYLRILRFFRFNAWYGASGFDEDALEACAKHAKSLAGLSVERVTAELLKLLSAPYVYETLSIIKENEILSWLFDETISEEQISATKHPLARLLVLARVKSNNLQDVLGHLRLSGHQEKFMKALLEAYDDYVCINKASLKSVMYFYGKEIAFEWLNLRLNQDQDLYKFVDDWSIPAFPISGSTLMELGIDQGPKLGQHLKKLEQQWIKNDFDDSTIDLTAISLQEEETSK